MILARSLTVAGAVALLLAGSPAAFAGGATTTGTWTDIKVPLPANADHTFAQLNSVTCPTATACTAVGSYTGSAGYQGLLVAKSGSTWTAKQAPVPKGAPADPFTDITDVSCFSASVCAAIGSYTDSSGNTQGVLLTGSGSFWKAVKAPLPAGASASSVSLVSVRCASATSCVAVGSYMDSSSPGNPVPLLVSGFGTAWTAPQVSLPAGASTGASLASVACTGSSGCTAVGYYNNPTSGFSGLIVTGSASSWTATQAPVPSGGSAEWLAAVHCTSVSPCVAAGFYIPPSGSATGVLLSRSGATWSATAGPLPANAAPSPQAQLQMLACPGGTACTAIGMYRTTADNTVGLIVTGSGSTWAATQASLPGNAARNQGASLTDIACVTSGCVIGADYLTASGYDSPALLLGSGSSWSAMQPPIPGNNVAYAFIPAVACINKTSLCIGAGFYVDHSHNDQALLLTGPP